MTVSIIYFILSFLAAQNIQPIWSFNPVESIENPEEIPMGLDVKSTITISEFKALFNGVLKSSKHKPLWRKGDVMVWHRGVTTKLISASANKLRFQSDFYVRYKGLWGIKVTTQKTAVINATAKYNNATKKINLSYTVENIRSIPGEFEKWFKTNKTSYSQVALPAYIKKIKAGNISVALKKPSENKLQVNLVTPLNVASLSALKY